MLDHSIHHHPKQSESRLRNNLPSVLRLGIIGATGSIGKAVFDVLRTSDYPFEIIGVLAHRHVQAMASICQTYRPFLAGMIDPVSASELQAQCSHTTVISGLEAIEIIATHADVDIVVFAGSGISSFAALQAAIRCQKRILIANKELFILGGPHLCALAREQGASIQSIDSEHAALDMCLQSGSIHHVKQAVITASGGALRDWPMQDLHKATIEDVLKHPTWTTMGPSITVDCATLANKVRELIEAEYVFGLSPNQLHAVMHPESHIHAWIDWIDGSRFVQMHRPTMQIPIAYGLFLQHRLTVQTLDKNHMPSHGSYAWHIDEIDMNRYPLFKLGIQAWHGGHESSIVFSAASHHMTSLFLEKKIGFSDLYHGVDRVMQTWEIAHGPCSPIDVHQSAIALAHRIMALS